MSKENFDTTYNTLAEKEWKKAEHKSSTRIEKRNEMKERYTKHYAEYKKQLGNDKIICPLCNSKNIQTGKKGFSVGGAIVGGLVLWAVGMNDMQCTCMRCGYAWKPKDDIPYGLGEQMKITTLIRNNG